VRVALAKSESIGVVIVGEGVVTLGVVAFGVDGVVVEGVDGVVAEGVVGELVVFGVVGERGIVVGVNSVGRDVFVGERRLPLNRFRARSRSCFICWLRREIGGEVGIIVDVRGIVVVAVTAGREAEGVRRFFLKRLRARRRRLCIFCSRDCLGGENTSGCVEVGVVGVWLVRWPRKSFFSS
jgi:hypothetical protein